MTRSRALGHHQASNRARLLLASLTILAALAAWMVHAEAPFWFRVLCYVGAGGLVGSYLASLNRRTREASQRLDHLLEAVPQLSSWSPSDPASGESFARLRDSFAIQARAEELASSTAFEFLCARLSEPGPARLRALYDSLVSSDTHSFSEKFSFLHRDGTIHELLVTMVSCGTRSSGPVCSAMSIDLTPMTHEARVEAALNEVAKIIPDRVALVRPDGTIQLLPGATHNEESGAKSVAKSGIVGIEDLFPGISARSLLRVREAFSKSVFTDSPQSDTVRLTDSDGSERYLRYHLHPPTRESGASSLAVLTISDITDFYISEKDASLKRNRSIAVLAHINRIHDVFQASLSIASEAISRLAPIIPQKKFGPDPVPDSVIRSQVTKVFSAGRTIDAAAKEYLEKLSYFSRALSSSPAAIIDVNASVSSAVASFSKRSGGLKPSKAAPEFHVIGDKRVIHRKASFEKLFASVNACIEYFVEQLKNGHDAVVNVSVLGRTPIPADDFESIEHEEPAQSGTLELSGFSVIFQPTLRGKYCAHPNLSQVELFDFKDLVRPSGAASLSLDRNNPLAGFMRLVAIAESLDIEVAALPHGGICIEFGGAH